MSKAAKDPSAPRTVLIVEPDDWRRSSHRLALERSGSFAVAAAVAGKREALAHLARRPVDFVITNSLLPDGNPADVIRSAKRANPNALVLAVSDCEDENIVMHTIVSGANGYVLFSDASADPAACLRVLQAGGSPASPPVARTVLRSLQSRTPSEAQAEHTLTPRELDVLRLLAEGLTMPAVCSILALSDSTVSTHVRSIYRKLDVHSRSQAVLRAQSLHIV